jgi:L-threonylcarbamoyladenylate synthase
MEETHSPNLIRIDAEGNFQPEVKSAGDILRSGGVVAYPTETLYGLGVDIRVESAIRRLFSIKERPAGRPVLILIPSVDALSDYVTDIPQVARDLIQTFWPGNLTLVFKAGPKVSALLSAGTGKIGIRLSSHPVATALARAVGGPITGTSANLSGRPACQTAQEILETIGRQVDLILDAGPSVRDTGSTILDVSALPLQVLREGIISRKQLIGHSFDII